MERLMIRKKTVYQLLAQTIESSIETHDSIHLDLVATFVEVIVFLLDSILKNLLTVFNVATISGINHTSNMQR